MISHTQALKDDLQKAIQTYVTRSGAKTGQALCLSINYLTEWIAELVSDSPPRLAKRRQLTNDESDSSEKDDDDSEAQCANDHPISKVSGVSRKNAPRALKQFRARTEHDFEVMQAGKYGFICAQTEAEVAILRYHCFIASEVDQFPYTTEWSGNLHETAYRIMKAVAHPPKSADNEADLLLKLNEHTKKKFESNTSTFSNRIYCGTPDAIYYRKGAITSVAEFKLSNQSFTAAKNQLIVYLVMFDIPSGWIVTGPPSKVQLTNVELTTEMIDNLKVRYAGYLKFLKALAAQKAD